MLATLTDAAENYQGQPLLHQNLFLASLIVHCYDDQRRSEVAYFAVTKQPVNASV